SGSPAGSARRGFDWSELSSRAVRSVTSATRRPSWRAVSASFSSSSICRLRCRTVAAGTSTMSRGTSPVIIMEVRSRLRIEFIFALYRNPHLDSLGVTLRWTRCRFLFRTVGFDRARATFGDEFQHHLLDVIFRFRGKAHKGT